MVLVLKWKIFFFFFKLGFNKTFVFVIQEASLRIDEEESQKEDSLQDGCLVEFGEDCNGNWVFLKIYVVAIAQQFSLTL